MHTNDWWRYEDNPPNGHFDSTLLSGYVEYEPVNDRRNFVRVYTATDGIRWDLRGYDESSCLPRASTWDELVQQYHLIDYILDNIIRLGRWERSVWDKGASAGIAGPQGVAAAIHLCGEPTMSLVFKNLAISPQPPRSLWCDIRDPATTDIAFRKEDTIHRTIELPVSCTGAGKSTLKLSLSGPNPVSPALGVQVKLDGPFDVPIPVSTGVVPVTLELTASRDAHAVPGSYNVSYVVVMSVL